MLQRFFVIIAIVFSISAVIALTSQKNSTQKVAQDQQKTKVINAIKQLIKFYETKANALKDSKRMTNSKLVLEASKELASGEHPNPVEMKSYKSLSQKDKKLPPEIVVEIRDFVQPAAQKIGQLQVVAILLGKQSQVPGPNQEEVKKKHAQIINELKFLTQVIKVTNDGLVILSTLKLRSSPV